MAEVGSFSFKVRYTTVRRWLVPVLIGFGLAGGVAALVFAPTVLPMLGIAVTVATLYFGTIVASVVSALLFAGFLKSLFGEVYGKQEVIVSPWGVKLSNSSVKLAKSNDGRVVDETTHVLNLGKKPYMVSVRASWQVLGKYGGWIGGAAAGACVGWLYMPAICGLLGITATSLVVAAMPLVMMAVGGLAGALVLWGAGKLADVVASRSFSVKDGSNKQWVKPYYACSSFGLGLSVEHTEQSKVRHVKAKDVRLVRDQDDRDLIRVDRPTSVSKK